MFNRFEIFTKQIAKISRSIRKIKIDKTARFNLTSPCVSTLYYLYNFKSLTAHKLCELCDEDKGGISRTLDYLEKNEFISCSCINKKRYNSPITLTNKGEEISKEIVKIIDEILNEVSFGISDEDRDNFYKTLFKISDNLQKISKNEKPKV